MKRFFLVIVLISSALWLPAQILVSFKNDSTCKTDTIIVPLKVQELRQCASFRIEFSFQDDIIRYDSLYFRNPALSGLTASLDGNNRLVIEWTSASAIPFGTGNIAKIQFTALQTGISLLSFDAVQTYFKDEQGNSLAYLYSDGSVKVHPRGIQYTLSQLMMGCSKEDKGRYGISILSGTPPYQIDWDDGFLMPGIDTVVLGVSPGQHKITIVDGNGCIYRDNYFVKVLKAPPIHFTSDPDTVYLQKPSVQFYSNIDSLLNVGIDVYNFQWNFGEPDSSRSVEKNPLHTFTSAWEFFQQQIKEYRVRLYAINNDNCDTAVVKFIPLQRPKVEVPNVFTPNADGINDVLIIKVDGKTETDQPSLLRYYERMELVIMNRWGRKLYESKDYRNDWDGGKLANGTYFYVLKCIGRFGEEVYKGSIAIMGSKN
ncbi:MAG: hypothetical protein STSR0006_11030 [Lentimicrobium sp.]|nr:gliding motility-associated C-terminal domain-containing protein [Bacteroidales bacterium]